MGWNVIPFRRRRRLDWIEGVTPRKSSWRIPIKPAALGLALGALMAVAAIWLPPVHIPPPLSLPSSPPQQRFQSEHLPQLPSQAEHFGRCFVGGGYNCVVDGDTFWYHGARIRIADIDTPETHPPRCAHEARLGRRATLRLQELLNQGPFILKAIDRDHDQYGRQLRIVMRDGASLGVRLADEGLARRWTGHREPWC